jgi:hypothetical protein
VIGETLNGDCEWKIFGIRSAPDGRPATARGRRTEGGRKREDTWWRTRSSLLVW